VNLERKLGVLIFLDQIADSLGTCWDADKVADIVRSFDHDKNTINNQKQIIPG